MSIEIIDENACEIVDGVLCMNGRSVKALVLAAGEGTRLRPLTLDRPKPMLPVHGKPLIGITLERLHATGIWEVAINLHYRPQAIMDYVGDGSAFGLDVTYLYEPQLLGSAGAVREMLHWIGDSPLLLVYGDILTDLSFTHLLRQHALTRAALPDICGTLGLQQVDNPTECGIVAVNSVGRITRYVEKPAADQVFSKLAHAGVSVLEPHALREIEPHAHDFGRDVFPAWIAAGMSLHGWRIPSATYLLDIGTPDRYERAQREWATTQP